jgi:hypothetical protein
VELGVGDVEPPVVGLVGVLSTAMYSLSLKIESSTVPVA